MVGLCVAGKGVDLMASSPTSADAAKQLLQGYGIASFHNASESCLEYGLERPQRGGKRGFVVLLCLAYFAMALLKLAMLLPFRQYTSQQVSLGSWESCACMLEDEASAEKPGPPLAEQFCPLSTQYAGSRRHELIGPLGGSYHSSFPHHWHGNSD